MNIFAILNHMGVFFKEEPVRQLHAALEKAGYDVVYPVDDKDLIKMIEMNPRICGVLFDWDKYSLELCERISKVNEKLPVHAFANEQSTLDISLTDLRLNVHFFEYALGMADDIAIKINQATQEYKDAIMPPFTKALFKYVEEGKYTFCTPGHMGGTAFQKSLLAAFSTISTVQIPSKRTYRFRCQNWAHCSITPVHTKKRKSTSRARSMPMLLTS